jgi:hypothetical protein
LSFRNRTTNYQTENGRGGTAQIKRRIHYETSFEPITLAVGMRARWHCMIREGFVLVNIGTLYEA